MGQYKTKGRVSHSGAVVHSKCMFQNTVRIVRFLVSLVLLIDALGFIVWVLSGQKPIDGWYIGAVTAHVVRAVI